MSLSQDPMSTIRVIDPRVDYSDIRNEFAVISGSSSNTWVAYTTSSFSDNILTFSCPPPSPSIVVAPTVYLAADVLLEFSAAAGATGLGPSSLVLNDDRDAFRAYPISSITSTLTVSINNASTSINLSDIIHALLRYNTDHNTQEYDYSACPKMEAYVQEYRQAVNTVRNSLSSFSDNSYETTCGSHPYTQVVNNLLVDGTATASVRSTIVEPIFISPFVFGKNSQFKRGFIGVTQINMQFTLADRRRMWSHVDPIGVSDYSFSMTSGQRLFQSNPALLFEYLTPKLLEPIPSSIAYDFNQVTRYVTATSGDIPAMTDFTITSNNIQFGTICKRLYIYARPSNAYLAANENIMTTTDNFASLKQISCTWNNVTGILSGATPHQLWQLSAKNGCELSFPEWCGSAPLSAGSIFNPGMVYDFITPVSPDQGATGATYYPLVGSVLALDFGVDIAMNDLEAPSSIMNSMFSLTATFTNLRTSSVPYELYIVAINNGTWTISNLSSYSKVGVLSKEDILNSQTSPMIDYRTSDNIYGGAFGDRIKKFSKNMLAGIKSALPAIQKGIKVAGEIAPIVAPLVGLGSEGGAGVGGTSFGGAAVGGMAIAGAKRGRGGAMISRSQLQKRLMV